MAKNGIQKRKIGRPSKLTPDVIMRVLSAVRCGAPNKIACQAAGICEETFYAWLRRADEQPGSEYSDFSERLTQARQEGVSARLALIMKAANSDWRAAAWLLERDCPEAFSLKFKLEHSVEKPFTLADAMAALRERRELPDYEDRRSHELPPPGNGDGGP